MEGLIINIMASTEAVLADPTNYQGRADLMWCATMALNGWTSAGLGLVGFPMHMIEHTISAHYGVAHGAGLSVVIPGWLSFQAKIKPEKIAKFARKVFAVQSDDDYQAALAGIDHLKNWFHKIGSPVSLIELNIPAEAISKLAKETMPLAKTWRLPYDEQKVETILTACL